jgi:branched-subunit amino acid aminotransferase/4-amino-4-deoxychorismate lyase
VTPVSQIDDYKIPVGPICRQLAEDYERLVRSPQTAKATAA